MVKQALNVSPLQTSWFLKKGNNTIVKRFLETTFEIYQNLFSLPASCHNTPVEAQGSAGWLNSLFSFSCMSFLPLPSSSFSSTDPAPFRPSSSSSIPLLFLSSSSWVTLFSQAWDAEMDAGLGPPGAELPASLLQATPSSDDNLQDEEVRGQCCSLMLYCGSPQFQNTVKIFLH